ncbi:MAG TPA: hypothetical protein VJR47_19465 [Stellaceae bacterium]|nr:hypothetical protein [Stellaceae bacterium]
MQGVDRLPPLSGGRFWLLFALLLALSAVPLGLTALPPLLDYPNHLARMHLLPRLPDAILERSYAVAWAPLPNLAMDGVIPWLAAIMPLEWAGKLFILLAFALLAGGAAALQRVLFGTWSAWSLLAFLLLYSRLLLWGFTGYLFGCGLALAAFAAWIPLRRRPWVQSVALGCAFATAIYLAHLLAFGLYAVMIASYEWGAIWRGRPPVARAVGALVIGGAPFLPGLLLLARNSSSGRVLYANPLRKVDLLFSVFDDYSRPFDVACFVLAVLAIAAAFQRRWLRIAPEMAAPLIGLVIVYLAMPTQLFTAAGADRRIPLMIFLVLIASSAWVAPRRALSRAFLAAAGVMFLLRLGVVAFVWHESGLLYAELAPGLDRLPVGSCVANSFDGRGIEVQKAPLTHFATLAVVRRDAFVTSIFAYRDQQPIRLTPTAQHLADQLSAQGLWDAFVTAAHPLPPPMQAALAQCGYIAFAGVAPFSLKAASGLEPVFVMPRFQLYRVASATRLPS